MCNNKRSNSNHKVTLILYIPEFVLLSSPYRLETGHVVSRSPAKSKQIDLNQQGSIADLQPLNCGKHN